MKMNPNVTTAQIPNSQTAAFATEAWLNFANPIDSTPMYQSVSTLNADRMRWTGSAISGSWIKSTGPGVARVVPITTTSSVVTIAPKSPTMAESPQTSTACI